jgi:hypothetical protein
MTRLFERFERQVSNPKQEIPNGQGMGELASQWSVFSADLMAYSGRQGEQMTQASMIRTAEEFRAAALVLSDESESGRNLRNNLVFKRNTNQLTRNGKPGSWIYYIDCRNFLVEDLRDLAAYYERRAVTGEDVFIHRPDRAAAPIAPLDVPITVAGEDVCGQIVHQIMSNLAC